MATFIARAPLPEVRPQVGPSVRNEARVDLSPLVQGVQAVGAAATDLMEREAQRIDTARIAEARTALESWWNDARDPNNPDGLSAHRGERALEAEDKLLPKLDGEVSRLRRRLNRRQQEQFDAIAGGFRTQVQGSLVTYAGKQNEEAIAAKNTALVDTLSSSAARYGMDGDIAGMETTLGELGAATERIATDYGMPAEVARADAAKARSAALRQAIVGALGRSVESGGALFDRYGKYLTAADVLAVENVLIPAERGHMVETAARAALDGGPIQARTPVTFDDAIGEVLAAEGGFADDPDDRGGATNFGISSRANPDVDVANLTQGQARELYRSRYWNALGADKLPPAIRGIAFDAAVNQGVDQAKRWASESGGDPGKYAQLRLQHYEQLVARDPSQGKFLQGWRNRVARYTGGNAGPAQDVATARTRLRQSPLASEPELLRAAERQVANEFAYRQQMQDVADRDAGNAIFEKVTASEPAAPLSQILTPQEVTFLARNPSVSESIDRYRRLTSSGEVIKDDPVTVDKLARMQATDPGKFQTFQLATVADKLSGQTLLRFTKDQAQANNPEKVQQWASEDQLLSLAASELGLSGGRRAELTSAYLTAKRAWMRTNGGKEPDADQTQTILNQLKLPLVKSGFLGIGGGKRRAYQEPQKGYTVPASERTQIVAALQGQGIANPTEAQILATYLTADPGSDL